ncbi:hypothetical protein PspLS_06281 [Pyricularia sp. CBS 133598]|nr:hypothetical protein PspLS_06281 [Pyricularia sp. CBS 133598]
MVYDLSDEEVSVLAAENGQAAAERIRCNQLLSTLHANMVELKRLDGHRPAAKIGVNYDYPPPHNRRYSPPLTPEMIEQNGHLLTPSTVSANPQDEEADSVIPPEPPVDLEPARIEEGILPETAAVKKEKKKKTKKKAAVVEEEPQVAVNSSIWAF